MSKMSKQEWAFTIGLIAAFSPLFIFFTWDYYDSTRTKHFELSIDLDYTLYTPPAEFKQENDCGQVAMYTVLRNNGIEVDPAVLFEDKMKSGTKVEDIVDTVWRYLPITHIPQGGTFEDLWDELDHGNPVLLVTWKSEKEPHGVLLVGVKNWATMTGPFLDQGYRDWKILDGRGTHTISSQHLKRIWKGQYFAISKKVTE